MAKLKTDTWKKLVYIIPAVLYTFFISMLLLGIIIASNIDHYKDGVDYLSKGNFELALENLSKVETDNPNYQNAQSKIKEIESKLLEMKIEKENQQKQINEKQELEYEKELSKLKEFQKFWADSIVKSWKGKFIINYKLNTKDTIFLELSENATKSYNSNIRDVLPSYQFSFNNSIKNKIGITSHSTIIYFAPNSKLLNSSNSKDYTHPVFKNTGMKIYQGNQFSKEFLGVLECESKNKESGMEYYHITTPNGKNVKIEKSEFNRLYWVKLDDPNYKSYRGLNKCF